MAPGVHVLQALHLRRCLRQCCSQLLHVLELALPHRRHTSPFFVSDMHLVDPEDSDLPCSVPPGRQAVLKIAGVPRTHVARIALGVGAALALWTGATKSLTLGLGLGAGLVGAHAVLRTPNLRAKVSTYHSRAMDSATP